MLKNQGYNLEIQDPIQVPSLTKIGSTLICTSTFPAEGERWNLKVNIPLYHICSGSCMCSNLRFVSVLMKLV